MAEGGAGVLTSKLGPAPVWVWGGGSLLVLWIVAKYRDMKKAAAGNDQPQTADATGDYAAEGQAVAPQFIIENNMPQDYDPAPSTTPGPPSQPSKPVKTPQPPPVGVHPPGVTPHPPVTSKPAPPTSKPTSKPPIQYKVKTGDNLSKIAAKYTNPKTGKKFTADELFAYNTTPGVRPAATITTLKKRGKNLLYGGETILIPQ